MIKKLNLYFFDDEQPELSDLITYYGTYTTSAVITLFTLFQVF